MRVTYLRQPVHTAQAEGFRQPASLTQHPVEADVLTVEIGPLRLRGVRNSAGKSHLESSRVESGYKQGKNAELRNSNVRKSPSAPKAPFFVGPPVFSRMCACQCLVKRVVTVAL